MTTNQKKDTLLIGESQLKRNLSPKIKLALTVWAVLGVVAHLYSIFLAFITPQLHLAMHLAFACSIVFILYKPVKSIETTGYDKIPVYDIMLSVISLIIPLYIFVDWQNFVLRGASPKKIDMIFTFILIALILEGARRTMGLVLPIICLCFVSYAFLGPVIPGILGHRGATILRFTSHQFMKMEGIFSSPTQVSAKMIFMFILFGAFLVVSGAGEILLNMSYSLAGRAIGGPGKIAVVGSALMGMVSGSATANVATTGQFTIPMMKKTGFKPQLAGAVEAVASTGGTLTPPIMGAGAFIMAELLGISYLNIVKAAIIPACLYYFAVYVIIHYEAKKSGLKPLPKEQIPKLSSELRKGFHILIPIIFLLYLVFSHYPIMRAAFYSILVLILVSQIQKENRVNLKKIIGACEAGMYNIIPLAMCCATAGIVIGTITLTGLGTKFAAALTAIAGDQIYVALFIAMAITIILGMGLPATAAYIVAASVTAPAIVSLGFPSLGAHMFVFYYACLAQITPPVAMAAYVGATIAGSDPLKTAMTSVRLALVALVIPYMFIRAPSLLMVGETVEILYAAGTAVIGTLGLGLGLAGFLITKLSHASRLVLIIGGVLLIDPGTLTNIIGISMILIIIAMHFVVNRKMLSKGLADTM